ncbi:unnamed protein product [Ceratitis capitata]|uniref:(Mediterranean fruit fly) hypothetical protein n=1 Tax=Ceratitis capitata TaxID=7213 RepID=A0A811ULH9_CERCA|nr:unnamed protein product [Ceratitis capitata]
MSRTHLQSVDDETFQGLRLKTLKLIDNELQDISERSFRANKQVTVPLRTTSLGSHHPWDTMPIHLAEHSIAPLCSDVTLSSYLSFRVAMTAENYYVDEAGNTNTKTTCHRYTIHRVIYLSLHYTALLCTLLLCSGNHNCIADNVDDGVGGDNNVCNCDDVVNANNCAGSWLLGLAAAMCLALCGRLDGKAHGLIILYRFQLEHWLPYNSKLKHSFIQDFSFFHCFISVHC